MKSPLPPLRAVEIFVVAGRALSFSAAAKTVNLTPSAVSRRMRDLERDPGTTLFRRFNRRLELTAAGARFLDAASRAIELIARESDAIRPRHRGTMLRLSVLQSLASTWLSPRLASLRAAFPVAAPGLLPEGGLVSVTALDQTDLLDIVQASGLWALPCCRPPRSVVNPTIRNRLI